MLVVPLWFDLGFCSQTVAVLKLRRTLPYIYCIGCLEPRLQPQSCPFKFSSRDRMHPWLLWARAPSQAHWHWNA